MSSATKAILTIAAATAFTLTAGTLAKATGLPATSTNATAKSAAEAEEADTLSQSLSEITVVAPEAMRIGNRAIYTPTPELKKISNSTIQLLSGVQIPELIVNPTTGSIEIIGGGELSVRINGRPASQQDLFGVTAKDISKVEYITNPGVRYGSAAGVLDITVKRPLQTGASVFGNLMQSVNRGWGDYTAGAKYNVGRSEWSIDYKSNPMWHMNAFRDNDEVFHLSDGHTVYRTEEGIKTPNRMVTHRASLQYSYAKGSKTLFNVQARMFRTNDYYQTTGDITTEVPGLIHNVGTEYEAAPLKSWQGDLDIYFHHRITDKHAIYINVVPTILTSESQRIYETTGLDIHNQIKSDGSRLLAEAIWEGSVGKGNMAAGLRSNGSWTTADQYPSGDHTRETENQHYLFTQWRQSVRHWYYEIGAGVTFYNATHPVDKNYVAFNPRLLLKYNPSGNWGSVTLYGESKTKTPGINDINPIVQRVDLFQWHQGNPTLKPYQQYIARLEIEGRLKSVSGKLTVEDTYSHNPCMETKFYAPGIMMQKPLDFINVIMQQPFNYGKNNDFMVKGQVRFPLFSLLNFSVEGGWHTTLSKGVGYSHRYSQPFVNAQMMLMKGHVFGMIKYNTTFNSLWGESVQSTNQNLMILAVGYSYKSMTFLGSFVNPFGQVSLRSRNMSDLASYDRLYKASSSKQLAVLGIIFNFRTGKARAASQKKLENDRKYESISNTSK